MTDIAARRGGGGYPGQINIKLLDIVAAGILLLYALPPRPQVITLSCAIKV
jgi:hypothetical protein